MKKIALVVVIVTILVLVVAGISSAQQPSSLPGTAYWFGATQQNVGTGDATIVVTAYDSASNAQFPYSPAPLAPGASINVGPNDIPGLPAGFIGSIVVSSNEPLKALVNITNRLAGSFGTADGKAAGLYSGIEGNNASTALSFPLAKNNHFGKTTTFYLQNAGAAATTINVTFSFNGINYPYVTPSVGPGKMIAVDPGLASVPAGNGQVGAMTLTASQPIAGVMLEHEHSAAVGTVLQGSSGFSPAELDQVAYCPAIKKNYFGRTSGLQAQNAHTVAQDITVTFVDSGGNEFTSTATGVAAGASHTFINDAAIVNGLYSAIVEGSLGNVAAIVNESELPLVNARQTSQTYNCQAASTATTSIAYPAYKETFFGRTSALQLQNVGTAAASNVVLTFTDNNGNVRTSNAQSIPAGASSVYVCVSANAALWSGTSLAASTLSGVTITSDQPIVGIVNEASWTSANPCAPNNGASSFDKAISNTFNLQ